MSILTTMLLMALLIMFDMSHVSVHGAGKHIYLCTTIGGISHSRWLFEIGNVLIERGYQVTYITDEYNTRFTSGYPNLDVQPILPPTTILQDNTMFTSLNELSMWKTLQKVLESEYDANYNTMMTFFDQHPPDMVVCDMILDFCIDAAIEYGAPVAITSTSTLMHRQQGICHIPFLQWACRHLLRLFWYPFLWEDNKIHALKLVNNYFGLEPAQDLDPLTHMVGPILPDYQSGFNLSNAEQQFLATHEKVILVAFGQHQLFHHDAQETACLDMALQEHQRCGNVDGVIWLTREETNICNNQRESKRLDYMCVEWINQHAILHHPSVRLLISHGGSGSLHESLDAGVPLLLFPSMADQIPNAKQLQAEGVARWHPRGATNMDVQSIIEDLEFLLYSDNPALQDSLKRHKTLVDLGKRRKYYVADLLEELVLTSSIHGRLEHRIKKMDTLLSWFQNMY